MSDIIPGRLSDDEIVAALVDDNATARTECRQALAGDLQLVVEAGLKAYRAIDACNMQKPLDLRLDHARLG